MALKDKLHSIKMKSDEGVASYLTRVTQVKDELAAVGETIPDSELVRIALKGFTKKWEVFVVYCGKRNSSKLVQIVGWIHPRRIPRRVTCWTN